MLTTKQQIKALKKQFIELIPSIKEEVSIKIIAFNISNQIIELDNTINKKELYDNMMNYYYDIKNNSLDNQSIRK